MLLLAAGRGARLGADVPKAYLSCAGRTLLERSLERLARIPVQKQLLVAVDPAHREPHLAPRMDALRALGLDRVVDGGDSRQASMQAALSATDPACDLILVHDAARPFFPVAAAQRAIALAAEHGAALVALPTPDTLKRVDQDGRVVATVDRTGMWLAQTPQVARRTLLQRALDRAIAEGYQGTDDVSLLEHDGTEVRVVEGCRTNLKITTPADLELAELIAAQLDEAPPSESNPTP